MKDTYIDYIYVARCTFDCENQDRSSRWFSLDPGDHSLSRLRMETSFIQHEDTVFGIPTPTFI